MDRFRSHPLSLASTGSYTGSYFLTTNMGIANQGICSRRVQACYKRQRKWPLINLKLKGTVRFKEYVAGKTLDVNFNSSLPIAKYTIVRHTQQIWLEQI